MHSDFLLNSMSEDLLHHSLTISPFLSNFRPDDKNNNLDLDGPYGILVIMSLQYRKCMQSLLQSMIKVNFKH